jgi:hypothetical protein
VRTFALVIIVIIATAGRARAQPAEPTLAKPRDPEAARLYREGNGHYKVREYTQASERYAASIKLEESQAALYNIAQSHRQLGHYEDAIWFYRRLIDSAALAGPQRQQVEGLIAAMKSELDKRAASSPPLGVAVAREEPKPPPQTTSLDDGEGPAPDVPRWYRDRVGWSLGAGGAIVGGAAIGLALAGDRAQRDANHEPDELARGELRARADSRRTWAIATGVLGGGLAIAGIVRLALVRRAPGVSVAIGAGRITVAGRF